MSYRIVSFFTLYTFLGFDVLYACDMYYTCRKYLREGDHHHFTMLTVDINKQSWETGYKVIREVAKTDGK